MSYCFARLLQHNLSSNPEAGRIVGTEQHIYAGLDPELEVRRHRTHSNEFSVLLRRPNHQLPGFLHSRVTSLPWHPKTRREIRRSDEDIYAGYPANLFQVSERVGRFYLSHKTQFIIEFLLFSRNI